MSSDEANQEPSANEPESIPDNSVSRLRLLVALGRFQLKLLLDGGRDLLLSPISLITVLIGVLSPGDQPDRLFRKVMVWGRKSEDWINLFGYRRGAGADELLNPIEQAVLREAGDDTGLGRVNRAFNETLAKSHARRPEKPFAGPPSAGPESLKDGSSTD